MLTWWPNRPTAATLAWRWHNPKLWMARTPNALRYVDAACHLAHIAKKHAEKSRSKEIILIVENEQSCATGEEIAVAQGLTGGVAATT